jgi:uncharacterized protein with HEPN domain
MGEAAGKVDEEIKEIFHVLPWRQMSDLRNIVIHEYFGVDLKIIWQVIQVELPKVFTFVRKHRYRVNKIKQS